MSFAFKRHAPWVLAWLVLGALGAALLARLELNRLRDAFDTDSRIVHRLLSQRVVQHDAVMATLSLLQPATRPGLTDRPEQRISSVYPQILGVIRREHGVDWPDDKLQAAAEESLRTQRAVLVNLNLAAGRYNLLLAAEPASYALVIDLHATVPWSEWPMAPETSPVRVTIEHQGQRHVVQPGRAAGADEPGWNFEAHKQLASATQPFDVVTRRHVGWRDLPWPWIAGWAVLAALLLAGLRAWRRQRAARRRAEELLRLGQVARLNTLGELAAGMAHELNQPLTALLANTQAASRLLDEEPPELDTARGAMAQAAAQARRAAEVVGRLRRAVERPDQADAARPVRLQDAVDNALYLLEPELRRREVAPRLEMQQASATVLADPVALEQIIHNLLMNALQALDKVPANERRLTITLGSDLGHGLLKVGDSGPGFSDEVLQRLFEPFFTTRESGLGLGLSLCESLANGMGGSLTAARGSPRGALFRLALPLAPKERKRA